MIDINSKDAQEYVDAKMRHWLEHVDANLNSPKGILAALRFAAYEDLEQRNQGRDMDATDPRP